MITHGDAPRVLTKKIVAVLNEKLLTGVAMNALAHMALGLGTALGGEEALMCDYVDADGQSHPLISAYPFIILKGRQGKIRDALAAAAMQDIRAVAFTQTMTEGTYIEQLQRTCATLGADLEFYGAVFFGEVAAVSELTRKFSLYK